MLLHTLYRHMVSGFEWAWMDIKCKYRRSVIGPFWETINIFVVIMGVSYMSAIIFGGTPLAGIPYIGMGIIVWSAISALVIESTTCFIVNKEFIKTSSMGIDLYVSRTVFRVFISIAHYFVLYFIGLLFLPLPVSAVSLLSLVGLFFLFINALWLMPTLGFLCARFRDLELIIRNLLQLTFFVTPVFWNYKNVSHDKLFVVIYNPFFYFLEAIRAPLLGEIPPLSHYIILAGITVAGYGLMSFVYRGMRRNLAFYVG
jgi:ABC-type polysaccharide/polyol phosphate export permease